MRYHYNIPTYNLWEVGAYEIAFDYQNRSEYIGGGSSSASRWGFNALWYADNPSEMTLYTLLGVGAQWFSDEAHGTDDGLFAAVGTGVEYQLRGDLSVVGEGKWFTAATRALSSPVSVQIQFGQ